MTPSSLLLDRMTWPEVAEALKTVKVALLAFGSCEQHGPHLEMRTDTVRAYEIARRLAERFHPEVLLCPPIPLGQSEHHLGFPGTLSLRPSTLAAVVEDVLQSLHHHGVRKFLLINGHGGNNPVLHTVASEFKNHHAIDIAITGITAMVADLVENFTDGHLKGHACEVEVSQAMILAPEMVRLERLEAGQMKQRSLTYTSSEYATRIIMPYRFDEMTINGALGDATKYSRQFGQDMIDTALDRICVFLRELIDKPSLQPRPPRSE
jgi:creatinine amidohydrolase